MINLHEPHIGIEEKRVIQKCIDSGWISSSGKYINLFENKIKKMLNVKYALAFINCTSALQISLKIITEEKKNEVIVPSITFISPVNSVIYNNCSPIFMDTTENFIIDLNKTIDFLRKHTFQKKQKNKYFCFNKKTKNKIAAIIIVHTFGNACLMDDIYKICKRKNIKIIEDNAEGLGVKFLKGKYKKKYAGTIGDIGCLSFNGNKIISTGGGGMLITNNKKYYEKAKYLINQAKDNSIYYKHNETGYNYSLNNISASIGVEQLKKFKYFKNIKKEIYLNYENKFKKLKFFELVKYPDYILPNYWLNIVKVKNKKIKVDFLINTFKKNLIQVRPIWYPNHLQKHLKKYQTYNINKAKSVVSVHLCLPSSVSLTNNDINKIFLIFKSVEDSVK